VPVATATAGLAVATAGGRDGDGTAATGGGGSAATGPGTSRAPSPEAAASTRASDRGALVAALLERVRAHRRYPETARRRGIEGTVGVRVVAHGDGSAEVSVVRGADPLLDEAARAAVLAAGPFPPLDGPQIIEVDFHLTE
jgi:protein TonB